MSSKATTADVVVARVCATLDEMATHDRLEVEDAINVFSNELRAALVAARAEERERCKAALLVVRDYYSEIVDDGGRASRVMFMCADAVSSCVDALEMLADTDDEKGGEQ